MLGLLGGWGGSSSVRRFGRPVLCQAGDVGRSGSLSAPGALGRGAASHANGHTQTWWLRQRHVCPTGSQVAPVVLPPAPRPAALPRWGGGTGGPQALVSPAAGHRLTGQDWPESRAAGVRVLPLRMAANPALACTPPGSSLSRGFSSGFYYMIDYQTGPSGHKVACWIQHQRTFWGLQAGEGAPLVLIEASSASPKKVGQRDRVRAL